jgi:uncharacterized protein YbjT (DUF2867 family)
MLVTVFGGAGFIGRHIVQRLAAAGHSIRIAGRDTERAARLCTMGGVGQITPVAASVTDEVSSARAVAGADIVINLVGILFESRAGDFQRIQAEGAGRVARLAAAAGVKQFLHLSAIGADASSPSLYAQTKAAGEAAVLAAFPGAIILRPSVVFGPDDQLSLTPELLLVIYAHSDRWYFLLEGLGLAERAEAPMRVWTPSRSNLAPSPELASALAAAAARLGLRAGAPTSVR